MASTLPNTGFTSSSDEMDLEQRVREKCNWCFEYTQLLDGKKFCMDCNRKCFRECKSCRRPFPESSFFTLNEHRCNACEKKARSAKIRRDEKKAQKKRISKNKEETVNVKKSKPKENNIDNENSSKAAIGENKTNATLKKTFVSSLNAESNVEIFYMPLYRVIN